MYHPVLFIFISFIPTLLSPLKAIRTQLMADYRDKGEAIKISTKCILYDLNTPCTSPHNDQSKKNHVSHDKWLTHCKNLKQRAENLIKDSSSNRSNLSLTLVNVRPKALSRLVKSDAVYPSSSFRLNLSEFLIPVHLAWFSYEYADKCESSR